MSLISKKASSKSSPVRLRLFKVFPEYPCTLFFSCCMLWEGGGGSKEDTCLGLVLGTTVGHSCGEAVEVCSGDVVEVRGNSEGAISFGIDGCGVIGGGVGNTAVVCCMA